MEPIDSQPQLVLQTSVGQPTRQPSIDEDSLLYKTYDDYFNTEEEMHSPPGAPDPLSTGVPQRHLQPDHPPSDLSIPEFTQPFFFVLSSPSPASPHSSESYSLLEVINVTEQGTSSDHRSDQPSLSTLTPRAASMAESTPATPAAAEQQQPRGRRLVQLSGTLDPHARMTYPLSIRSSSVPGNRLLRHAQPMSMIESSPAHQASRHTIGKHVRGRSSPFPLPIRFSFAPPSIPGSLRTPYSYF